MNENQQISQIEQIFLYFLCALCGKFIFRGVSIVKRTGFIYLIFGMATAVSLLIYSWQTSQAAPTATTYYICDCQPNADGDCTAGNDANAGTDPAAPWQTYAQARSFYNSSIAPGDEILFCRGGAHDLSGDYDNQWRNTSCTADQPCVVGAYTPPWASGDEAKPILQRADDGHGFTLNNDSGHIFQNLDMRCTGCAGGSGWAFFVVEDADDILIDNVSMDGFTIGIHLRGCIATWCSNDRVTIRNSRFTNNSSQGFLGHGNDLLLENNYFENNGDGTVFAHNIYIAGDSGVTIRNNELYRASLDSNGRCSGTSLVGHGVINNLLIEGNIIREDVGLANQGCWGIGIAPAYGGTAESYQNLIIRGNRIENVGNVAIATGSCLDCTIENNVVVNQQSFGVSGVAVRPFGTNGEDTVSSNLIVRNNSFALATGIGIELTEGSGHTIVSNVISMTGSDSNAYCYDLSLAASSYDVIDYNICGNSAGQWATTATDLAAWQGQGWGANSQAAAPGFSSSTDLRPEGETAVLINAGHPTLSSLADFNGGVRDAQPDAGAYEWQPLTEKLFLPLLVK